MIGNNTFSHRNWSNKTLYTKNCPSELHLLLLSLKTTVVLHIAARGDTVSMPLVPCSHVLCESRTRSCHFSCWKSSQKSGKESPVLSENNLASLLHYSIKMLWMDCNDQKCSCTDCQLYWKSMLSLICRFFFLPPFLWSSSPPPYFHHVPLIVFSKIPM